MNTSACPAFLWGSWGSGDATDRTEVEEGKERKGSDTFLLFPAWFLFCKVKLMLKFPTWDCCEVSELV